MKADPFLVVAEILKPKAFWIISDNSGMITNRLVKPKMVIIEKIKGSLFFLQNIKRDGLPVYREVKAFHHATVIIPAPPTRELNSIAKSIVFMMKGVIGLIFFQPNVC